MTPEITPEPISTSNQILDAPGPTIQHYEPRQASKGQNLQESLEMSYIQPSNTAPNMTAALEQPQFKIRSDILPDHIVDGTRSRKRKEAYATLLQQPYLNEAIYAAFMTGTKHTYQDDLPPPPKNWKDLQKHLH